MGIGFLGRFFTEIKIISKQRVFTPKTLKNGLFLTICNLPELPFANRRYGGVYKNTIIKGSAVKERLSLLC